jgi:tetratricopeptide (TPR) repeat protein
MEGALPVFVVLTIGTFIFAIAASDIPVLKYLPGFRHRQRKRLEAEAQFALQQYGLSSREEAIEYARKAFEREDYEAAAEFYSRILAVFPLDVKVLYLRAYACFMLKAYLAALQDLNTVLQQATGSPQVYGVRAEVYLKLNNPAAALEDMNQIFALGTPNANGFITRARAYAHLNRFAEAIKDMNHVLETDARPSTVLYNTRGWYHSLAGHYAEAVLDLNKAVEINPENAYSYGSRGHTYFLMSSYPAALADFVKSAELKPDHTFAIAGQSITQHALGNIEDSRNLWHKLIDIDRRYKTADVLVDEYHPAEAFVNAARKIVADL